MEMAAQSCLTICTPWTIACQAPLSLKFSRQEYWSGSLSLGDLPDPGIKLRSPALQADSLLSEPPGKPSFYDKGSLLKKMGWMRAGVWQAWLLKPQSGATNEQRKTKPNPRQPEGGRRRKGLDHPQPDSSVSPVIKSRQRFDRRQAR